MLDTIRPGDDESDRDAGSITSPISNQSGQVHILAGPVDATLREQKSIERPGCFPPLYPAIGQVERRRREVEKGIIAAVTFRDEERRCQTALPARQAALEVDVARCIRPPLPEDLIVPRHQSHGDVRNGRGGRERPDESMDAIVPGEGGQPQVGDDEPLRRKRSVLVFGLGGSCHEGIGARLQLGHRLSDRQRSRHLLIETHGDVERARENPHALGLAHLVEVPARKLSSQVTVDDG